MEGRETGEATGKGLHPQHYTFYLLSAHEVTVNYIPPISRKRI